MKNFIKSYHDLVFTAVFLIYGSILETHTPFHITVAILLVGYSAYSKYIANKGKVLDKDLVVEQVKAENEKLMAKFEEFEARIKKAEKIAQDAEHRVGLMSPKGLTGFKEAKW